jgi:beta-glucosidase
VNSDTGIITQRAWGLESKSSQERIAAAVNAGVDVLSGFSSRQEILDVIAAGLLSEERLDQAVSSLLREQFALGLFENPYVDASKANGIVGKPEFQAKALDAQRRSLTLLKNDAALPMKAPQAGVPVKLYSINLNASVLAMRPTAATRWSRAIARRPTATPAPRCRPAPTTRWCASR